MDNEIELVLYEGFTADGTYAIGMNEADWKNFKATLEYYMARAEAAERGLTSLLGGNWPELTHERELRYRAESRVAELEARLAWRPVTGDDLPDDHQEVLITAENEDGYRFTDMAEFTVGGNWWQYRDDAWKEVKRVSGWQPLPSPAPR